MSWIFVLVITIIFLIASIPLNFSAKIMGGHSTIVKSALTNLLAGFFTGIIYFFFSRYAALIAFIATLFIYKVMFSIGWIKAFLVWVLEGIIIVSLFLAVIGLGLVLV